MTDIVELRPDDIIADRPFAHPDHIRANLSTLRWMGDHLRQILAGADWDARSPQPIVRQQLLPDDRHYRVIIAQPARLQTLRPVAMVGFFGQRRPEADPVPLNQADQAMIDDFPKYDGLLSYSTLELPEGDFCNLILFSDVGAKNVWSGCEIHARVAHELAPDFYFSIRLYNGSFPEGIRHSRALSLHCVKYLDYQSAPFWRAIRTL